MSDMPMSQPAILDGLHGALQTVLMIVPPFFAIVAMPRAGGAA